MPRAMLNPLRLLLVLDTKHKKPALARDSLAVSSPADAKRLQASGARPSAPAAVERGAVEERGGAEGEGGDRCWEMEASVGRMFPVCVCVCVCMYVSAIFCFVIYYLPSYSNGGVSNHGATEASDIPSSRYTYDTRT